MMNTQEQVLINLVIFLIENNVELVLVDDRVTLRRINPDLTTADVDVDLAKWIFEG